MAGITFKHVKKTYDNKVTVVPDLNLEIRDKEFIVLVGPSGCGKSTTLRMIAGLEEISGGELYIGDKLVNDVAATDRDIAMVFQSYALYPHMTVYKNMAFALQLKKVPKAEIDAKVHEVAQMLELEEYLGRKPKELSGGQRQRVALGRAMVRSPKVFLLDEPLSNLDAKLRTEMRSQISALHKRLQATFVYVTHDQTEAMTMGDRIVVMKAGVIQQVDTPQNLYEKPDNIFVAGFIGSPQMNFIEMQVAEQNGAFVLECDGLSLPGDAWELGGYVGKKVMLGVRPENLSLAPAAAPGSLSGQVSLAEMMGSETYVYFNACGEKLIARVPFSSGVHGGDTVHLTPELAKAHLFDLTSGLQGQRIPRKNESV